MKRQFEAYIGVDYSGAVTPERGLAGLRVYRAERNEPQAVLSPDATASRPRHWSRRQIADWLAEQLRSGKRCMIGIDHGFSFPASYFQRYRIADWPTFLEDFCNHWPTDRAGVTVDSVRNTARGGGRRCGSSSEMRLTECWTSNAKSVFQFDVQGSVAKSTHAGLPWLAWLRRQAEGRLHVWPFDGWAIPADRHVIAEVYPSVLRRRYPRGERTVDQHDAYSVARWLQSVDRLGTLDRYLDPPLDDTERAIALLEGWILGIA